MLSSQSNVDYSKLCPSILSCRIPAVTLVQTRSVILPQTAKNSTIAHCRGVRLSIVATVACLGLLSTRSLSAEGVRSRPRRARPNAQCRYNADAMGEADQDPMPGCCGRPKDRFGHRWSRLGCACPCLRRLKFSPLLQATVTTPRRRLPPKYQAGQATCTFLGAGLRSCRY